MSSTQGFAFGTTQPGGGGAAPAFQFSGGLPPASSAPSFNFGTSSAPPPAFNFNPPSTQTAPAPSFNFSGNTTTPASSLAFTPQSSFNFNPAAQPAAAATAPPSSFAFNTAPTSSVQPFSLSTQPALGLGFQQQQPPAGATSTTTTGASLSTSTVTTASSNLSSMNFRQLSEALNKWSNCLDTEEGRFIEQATRGNYWDRTLMINGDKITTIDKGMKKAMTDYSEMEHMMEAVKTNQRDLEAVLVALEESLPQNIIVEPERESLYNTTIDVNKQMQQMSEDLKEVVRHLNESNKNLDRHDPIVHILRIMNEHTDALQWMEDNTTEVKTALDDVSKMNQSFKRDHERSMRVMFKY